MFSLLILSVCTCVGIGHGSSMATYWNQRLDLYSQTLSKARKDPLFRLGNVTSNLSPDCVKDLQIYKDDLEVSKEWAVRASDAWGRVRAGVLEGNNVWLGNYDECMGIAGNEAAKADPHPDVRYCKAYFVDHGFKYYGAGINHTGNFGACVPKSCNTTDLNYFLNSIGMTIFQRRNQSFWVAGSWCVEEKYMGTDARAISLTVFLSIFLLLVLLGTLYDVYSAEKDKRRDTEKPLNPSNQDNLDFGQQGNNDGHQSSNDTEQKSQPTASGSNADLGEIELREVEKRKMTTETRHPKVPAVPSNNPGITARLLTSFSLLRNVPAILSTGQSRDTYKCLNGIRFFSMAWILLGHVHEFGITNSQILVVANPAKVREFKSRWSYAVIRQMNMAVEAFFVLSMALTMLFSVPIQFTEVKQQTNVIDHLSSILWSKLSPVYYLIIGSFATYYYYLGNGPLFDPLFLEVERCRLFWWSNILYINNYVHIFACMGWCWYLATDFHFYLLAPIFIILLYKKPMAGAVTLSVVFAIYVAVTGYISNEIFRGRLYYWNEFYVKPYTRCGSYLLGIALGYIFFRTNCKYKIKKSVTVAGWIVCLILVYTMIHTPMWNIECQIAYNVLSRPVHALALCWIIFACCTGHGGVIDWFLSWSGWVPVSRLTYVGYLIHPIVIFLTRFTRPDSFVISDWILVVQFCGVLMLTMGFSFIISLVLEVPMLGIERVLLPRNK